MIKCAICGKDLDFINYLHLRMHGVSTKQYKEMYPNMPMSSEEHKVSQAHAIRDAYDSGRKDRKIGKSLNLSEKGRMALVESGKRLGLSNKGRKHTKEELEKMSKALKGRSYEELMGKEKADKLKEIRTHCFDNYTDRGKLRRNAINASMRQQYLMKNDKKHWEKCARKKQEWWDTRTDEENHEALRKIIGHRHDKPNKTEEYVRQYLDFAFPGEWKFVGNGDTVIGRMNPDFININGQKKVIEVFGDFWHSKKVTGRSKAKEEQHKIDKFSKYGFKALILWECDINNNMDKIRKMLFKFCEV